jgi:hypothetical protein
MLITSKVRSPDPSRGRSPFLGPPSRCGPVTAATLSRLSTSRESPSVVTSKSGDGSNSALEKHPAFECAPHLLGNTLGPGGALPASPSLTVSTTSAGRSWSGWLRVGLACAICATRGCASGLSQTGTPQSRTIRWSQVPRPRALADRLRARGDQDRVKSQPGAGIMNSTTDICRTMALFNVPSQRDGVWRMLNPQRLLPLRK